MRQVEEALARQVIYGGDLVTNLLEVARLDEPAVVQLMAESMNLVAAPFGELPIPQGSVRDLVPGELASQQTLVPLVIEDGKLVLAVSEPLPADAEEQLGFALGLGIEQRAAPAVRVRQAIARVYGAPLERRMERLIARLAGATGGSGSMPPPLGAPPPVVLAPRPPSAPPPRTTARSFPAAGASAPPDAPGTPPIPASAAPPVASFDSEPPSAPLGVRRSALPRHHDPGPGPRAVRRRRGPLTLDAAKAEAEEAADRDALLDLYFDFSRQFFDYAALFIVHADIAEGRDAFGTGASREKVVGIGVPLDLPGLLSTARDRRASVVARPQGDGLDAVLLADLLRPRDAEMAIVPLVVRTRAVALLVGDCGEAGIDRASVHQIVNFSGIIGKAFERIIVRRKLDGFIAGSRSAGAAADVADVADVGKVDAAQVTPKKRSVPPPSQALLAAAGPVVAVEPFRPSASGSQASAAAPSGAAEQEGSIVAARIVSFPPPALAPPASSPPVAPSPRPAAVASQPSSGIAAPSAPPPPPANIASIRVIAGPPIPREEPESPQAMLASQATAKPASRPPVGRGEASQGRGGAGSAPVVEVVEDAEADPAALFDGLAWEVSEESGPPPSAAIAVPLHAPANRHSVRALPSVIVDIDQEVRALIERVYAGDPDASAEGELLRLGERAMRVIMGAFPGPITFDRARIATAAQPPRASECGPLLRLIAHQRKIALPFVVEQLESSDAESRGWATHLLAELPYLEGVPYLLLRLRDPDAAIRASAAISLGAAARIFPGEVVAAVNELAHAADPGDRAAAMVAMAELREPAQVPEMIGALGDGSEVVVETAERVLGVVTRQDLGADAHRWVKWWEQNGSRVRIEWLIDALTHEVSEIRRAAGDELKALTKEYFGYAADLPPRDRERAQQRYRDWWITEGKARFRRNR